YLSEWSCDRKSLDLFQQKVHTTDLCEHLMLKCLCVCVCARACVAAELCSSVLSSVMVTWRHFPSYRVVQGLLTSSC
uniref:Uncharacterized protein n=1 Tax=Oryzias latipes TaxID=8090 RepID=A0A3P9LJL4_ORYLA